MRVSIRIWGGLAAILAFVLVFSGGGALALSPSTSSSSAVSLPGYGQAPAVSLSSGLPEFPSNLTHFVYIVRENHVFDDYLGDCFSTINDTCNYGADYTTQTNHIADVPYLHHWAQMGTVFDNMYSSIDPYSAQAHAYLFSADVSGGSDSCSNTVEGTGSTTQWGIYNSSNVKAGSCSWSPDSGSQNYPSDGTIFDRFTGSHVTPSTSTPPFLSIGDLAWELTSAGSCAISHTAGIPGSLPGNSVALEYTGCGTSAGWWTNTTSGSVNYMPPTVNPVTHYPQVLFGCQYQCNAINPMSDQYAAYGFISYVADYGLPTYTFIELFDDHPGPSCPGSGVTYDTCIQWNDASMNLITQDIFNSTSPYKDNTVVAISEDDTQNGQNGPDHINSGRRFPFVLVAPPSVMKTGNPNPASCGITSGPCGNVVHQTFNTSNVLSVMERVELNVNPGIFSSSFGKTTFPMATNDQLAEGNPLEPVWRCGDPRVPCNTGTAVTPVLTTTAITPNPISSAPSGTVALSASADDQNGNAMTATFAWTVTPASLGTLSSSTSQTPTFTAGTASQTGHICENATAGTPSVTLPACAVTVVSSSAPTLTSVSVTPTSGSVNTGASLNLHGVAATSAGSNVYPPGATFAWTLSSSSAGTLNVSTGTDVSFTAGTAAASETVCLNVTYGSTKLNACSFVSVVLAPPTLTTATINPFYLQTTTGSTQKFWSQAYDQYGNVISANYAWSLSPASIGTISTTGPGNTTLFTAGSTAMNGYLNLSVTSGPVVPVLKSVSIQLTKGTTSLSASATVTPTSGTKPLAVSFSGVVSGGTAPYVDVWNFGDGSATVSGSGSSPTVSYTYSTCGTFNPTLSVTDSSGTNYVATISPVTVTGCGAQTLEAHASATPLTGSVPLQVQFSGSASGGTGPYTYAWTFGDGSASATGSSAAHTYQNVGLYTATLWVNDSVGESATALLGIDAVASGGAGSFSVAATASPLSGPGPLTVNFAAAASGGTGPYAYSWDFGDGSAATTGISVSHTFQNGGSYSVKVTATDSAGHTATGVLTITVSGSSTSAQGNGLSTLDLLLLIAVVVLVAALVVALVVRRHPKRGASEEAGASYAVSQAYEPAPMSGPPAAPVAPAQGPQGMGGYPPANDARAPDPFGGGGQSR